MKKSESQSNLKKNSNSNLKELSVNEYNRANTFENKSNTATQSFSNPPQNNAQYSKLCESEETYYYNNTNTDFELGNLKASKNSVATRNEENNNNNNNTTNINTNNNSNFINNNNINNNSKENKINLYVKCLEQKVRDQASRLSNAELYRFLCEKRIKQLNPQQTFPITESHFKENAINAFGNDDDACEINENSKMFLINDYNLSANNSSNKSLNKHKIFIPPAASHANFNQNNNNRNIYNNENVPIEKFNELKEKYEKMKNEKDFIKENNINFNNLYDKHNEFSEIEQEYYSIDAFDENEIKRKYKKLFLYFKKIVAEKNNFIELFRKEKAYSEELKTQNTLLKESFENEILKFGFQNTIFTSDNLLDLNKFKAEMDLIKRECAHYKNLTENYYYEIENLKNINQMLLNNKEKIMQTFEEGLRDLDEMKEKITFLEKENSALISQINSINSEKTLRNLSNAYAIKKETIIYNNNNNNNPNTNYNETINSHENVFKRNANNSSSKSKQHSIERNDEFSNEKTAMKKEEDNISVKSYASIISKTKKATITKHNRNKSDDSNLNYIQAINENINFKKNNNNKEFEFPKPENKENLITHHNQYKNSDFNFKTARPKSSLSHGKLLESNSSRNNFYSNSNNNFHSSNRNEILLLRITEYKKNYEKLNSEFEELLKIKSALEIENSNLNNLLNSIQEKNTYAERALEEKQNELKEYKKEKEKWNKDLANLLSKINEMSSAGNANSDNNNNNLVISLKEYRRLYEEISLEFEELKVSSRKKVKNQEAKLKLFSKENKEKSNLIEKLKFESQSLKKEIEFSRSSYEQIDSEKQFLNDNEKVKEKELSLALESAQRLKMQNEALAASGKNIEKEIEELKTEKKFQKQKFENEINLKIKESDELKLLYENAKRENQKIKEAKKDANKLSYSNYISQEIETLNNQLNEFIVKEKDFNLAFLKLEKLEKENEMLSNVNEEAKKNRISMENQIADLVSKKENLEKEISYLRKNTEFSDDIYNEKNKEIEKLKKLISDFKQDYSEIESKCNNAFREKEKIEEKNFDLQNDFNRKKDTIENLYQENLMLNDKVAVYKVNLNSLFAELKINLNKLNQRASEDFDSLLTQEFSRNVLQLVSILNNFVNNNYDEKSIFELTKDFLNVFLNEFEAIYEKLLENNAYVLDCNQKLVLMEDKLHNRDNEFTEILQNENRLKNKTRSMQEEIHKLNDYVKNLKEEIGVLRNANNCQIFPSAYNHDNNNNYNIGTEALTQKRTVSDKKFSTIKEFNNIKTSFDDESTYFDRNKLNETFVDDLKNENSKLRQDLDKSKREKITLSEFLNILVKNFPCKIISKMLQELLQGKEQLNKFENDILKIQQKIDSLENEYKKLESDDPSNKNQDLIKVIKTEKDNLRNLLNEYLHKIAEKKEQMKNIEKEIAQNTIRVKEIFDNSRENQENYKFLYNELNFFKEKLDNIKIENQCRNELSNILKESFRKLNDFIPKFNFEENYIKSNYDFPMKFSNTNDAYFNTNDNSKKNLNQNMPLNNPLLKKKLCDNLNLNNNNQIVNHLNKNPLLNKNKAVSSTNNISQLNEFSEGKSLLNNNANYNIKNDFKTFSHNNAGKVFENFKSNNIDIACLESNLFSEMSCNTSRNLDPKKVDFPRQNINYLNENSNSAFNKANTNIAANEFKAKNLLNSIKQNSYSNNSHGNHQIKMINNQFNANDNFNSGEFGLKDIDDLTKYESLQYNYSASIDLKKIESKEFKKLGLVREDGNKQHPEYRLDWNSNLKSNSKGFEKNENQGNSNLKDIYSNNRKIEIANFNEKLANNFSNYKNSSNYFGQFYDNSDSSKK